MTSANGNIFRVTGQWRGALMFTLICVRLNGWVNNCETGDLGRNRGHYDVIVMTKQHIICVQNTKRIHLYLKCTNVGNTSFGLTMSNIYVFNVYITIRLALGEWVDIMKHWALLSTFERRLLIRMTHTLAGTPRIGSRQLSYLWKTSDFFFY